LSTTLKPEVEEDLQIKINGEYFGNWTDVEINLGIDTFATASITAPFAIENQASVTRSARLVSKPSR
jgi:hypothetical protein